MTDGFFFLQTDHDQSRGDRGYGKVDEKRPPVELQTSQSGDDGRHGRADDGRVDGKEKDDQHDAGDGEISLLRRLMSRWIGRVHVARDNVGNSRAAYLNQLN